MLTHHYYIIIFSLIALKVVFWSCFCFYRVRRVERVQRVVVVQRGQVPQSRGFNDRSAIVNHEVPPDTVPCPQTYPVAPPAYDMGVPKSQHMPPSYNYAV